MKISLQKKLISINTLGAFGTLLIYQPSLSNAAAPANSIPMPVTIVPAPLVNMLPNQTENINGMNNMNGLNSLNGTTNPQSVNQSNQPINPFTKHKKNKKGENTLSIQFIETEIATVLTALNQLGNYKKKSFIIDPRVKGLLTLIYKNPIAESQLLNVIRSHLRLQGFSILEESDGKILRVVPETDAKFYAQPNLKTKIEGPNDALITKIFALKYETANNIATILRPLISPNSVINANAGNNTLVITDYADNVGRLAKVIEAIDKPTDQTIHSVTLKHISSIDATQIINKVLDDLGRGTQDASVKTVIFADPRNNQILYRAIAGKAKQIEALIHKLDQPFTDNENDPLAISKALEELHVVFLKHSSANYLATALKSILMPVANNGGVQVEQSSGVLSQLGGQLNSNGSSSITNISNSNGSNTLNTANGLGGTGGVGSMLGTTGNLGGSSNTSNAGTGNASTGSTSIQVAGANIFADNSLNALIIKAPEKMYQQIRHVINQLDIPRQQILIESLIIEVSNNKTQEFGIQWQALSKADNSGVQVIGGTNLNSRGSGTNIFDATGNLTNVSRGLNIGILDGKINLPGVGLISNLGVLARALENQAQGNVLSTPSLLTLNNEEAKIIIGQNVPFVTGQFTNNNGGNTPFQTIERQDVGLSLKVKPQIHDKGEIQLNIYQEASSVQDNSSLGITTNKRAIESNVLAQDGQIIVLGGLVQEQETDAVEKVPFLGDIPWVGNLFRYKTKKRNKTNLMVFLRPQIVASNVVSTELIEKSQFELKKLEDLKKIVQ